MVEATLPRGKYTSIHVGRLAVRARKMWIIQTGASRHFRQVPFVPLSIAST